MGGDPQDKKYGGERVALEIGDGNVIREFTTINRGTGGGGGTTRIGDDNWLLAYTHVAHDCQVGSHCVFSNNSTLAGHVEIGDWVIMGGFRSEEHTSELQSLMRISSAVFCLKKKTTQKD